MSPKDNDSLPAEQGDSQESRIYARPCGNIAHLVLPDPRPRIEVERADFDTPEQDEQDETPTLYGESELKDKAIGVLICVVEGKENAEAIRKSGSTAVYNSGGFENWTKDHSILFKSREVAIISGRTKGSNLSAKDVAESLVDIAARVAILTVGVRNEDYIVNWLEKGGLAKSIINMFYQKKPYKRKKQPNGAELSSASLDGFGFKIDLDSLDGVLGIMARHIVDTARSPQPELAVAASVCAIGALCGHRYRTEGDIRSNVFIVGVADSGAGKNRAREVINRAFREAGLDRHLGGHKIASGAGLLAAVEKQPRRLFMIDEFGQVLRAATDKKRSPRYQTEIVDNLTELYTTSNSTYLGTEYADQKLRPRVTIEQPCVCLYGTTTPTSFWDALSGGNVVDGSLARFVIIRSIVNYPDRQNSFGHDLPDELVNGLQLIERGRDYQERGNLVGLTTDGTTAIEPYAVPTSPEAKALFEALDKEEIAFLRMHERTQFTALYARLVENSWKFALISAVSFDPENPIIRGKDAAWAIGLVRHCLEATIADVKAHVSDNETEADSKKVLQIISAAGYAGIKHSDLLMATRRLDRRKRIDILQTLVESNAIVEIETPTAGRPKKLYVAALYAGE